MNMTMERDRVISVSLTEAEWQAFVARHPQPVDWLRQQILAQLPSAGMASAALASAPVPDARVAGGRPPTQSS